MQKLKFNGEMSYSAFLVENHLPDNTGSLKRFLEIQDSVTLVNGYTVRELKEAFDQVANKADWKAPIDSWILAEDWEIVSTAIEYMTATSPVIKEDRHNDECVMIRIVADGYRNGPAGP